MLFATRPQTQMTGMSFNQMKKRESLVPNFRHAAGFRNFFRSSAPDNLADILPISQQYSYVSTPLDESEHFVLYDVTLLIDLRSSNEINHDKQKALMNYAPGGKFEEITSVEDLEKSTAERIVLRLPECCLTKSGFLSYVSENWVTKGDDWDSLSEDKKNELVYKAVDENGLVGLNQFILEKNNLWIAPVLKAITTHLERNPDGKVLFHCSIGKDRTGLLAMFCASMLGIDDDEIVKDYSSSRCINSLATQKFQEVFGRSVNCAPFADANPATMHLSMQYLRQTYGSVSKFLDHVGFDESWRERFLKVSA